MRQRVCSGAFGVALIAHTYGRKNTSKERKGGGEGCYGSNCPPNDGEECWGACPCLSKTRSVAYLFSSGFPTHVSLSTCDASCKSYQHNFSKSSNKQAF